MRNCLLVTLIFACTYSLAQIRYYPLDGNANEIINNQNGILGGGTNAPTPTTDRFNNPASALSFDGDDHIILPVQGFNTPEYSICGWIMAYSFPVATTFRAWFAMGDNVGDQMLGIENNQFGVGLYFNGYRVNTDTFRLESSTFGINTWHHVCGVYGLDYARLYVDGVLRDSSYSSGSSPLYGPAPSAYFGARGMTANRWIGKIDNVGFYDYALPANQTTGLDNLETSNNSLLLYPNPVEDVLHISNVVGSVAIVNIQGQEILKLNPIIEKNRTINISKLSPGIYFLKHMDKKLSVQKFVKL